MPNINKINSITVLFSLIFIILSMVGWCWCWNIGFGLGVRWDTLVSNISYVSIIVVSSVLHILGTTIRKSDTVRSGHNTVGIRCLTSIEVSFGVVISNSILIGVWLWGSFLLNIGSRLVSWSRGMVSWSSMNNWSNFNNRSMICWSSNNWSFHNWSMICWSSYNWSFHDRSMISWSWSMVSWSWSMISWSWSMISWSWSMISWCSMDNWSMISWGSMNNRGMICWSWSSMVDWSRSISFLDWKSSWGNGSSSRLLIATIAMYRLRSSMRLTYNRSMYSSMGLVDRVADSRSITLFNNLMVGLVSNNYS